MTLLVQQIVELCAERRIQLHPHMIPGKLNVLANSLCRNPALPGEWEIHPRDEELTRARIPQLEMDVIATPFNNAISKFGCPFPQPLAWKWIRGLRLGQVVLHLPFSLLRVRKTRYLTVFWNSKDLCFWSSRIITWSALPYRKATWFFRKLDQLMCPGSPRQMIRGPWREDGIDKSSPSTIFPFCGIISSTKLQWAAF